MKKFDLCVIGGGPAGYAAAMRAIDFEKKVILIEKNKIGGYEIYDGVLASKTLWELSNKYYHSHDYLSNNALKKIKFKDAKRIINEAIFERKFQLSCHLRIIHAKTGLITYEKGLASFVDKHHINIQKENGDNHVIYAKNTIISTGSSPRKLPDIDVDEKNILTSDGIMHMKKFPKSIVVVGAGVIGCEFATIFSNFGYTKVHMIDRAERILPFEDDDISSLITKNFEKNQVLIHKKASLVSLKKIKDGLVEYCIKSENGKTEVYQVEKALLSVGRVPNIKDLKIKNAGIKLSKRSVHIGDSDTQTNIKNIFAVGDVSGRMQLVNVGEREARHAVVRLFLNKKINPINYENVSTIMFLNPVVASVGYNEQSLQKKNIPYRMAKVDYSTIARAIATRDTLGFFKLIVSDDDDMKVLGLRAVGRQASAVIQSVALLIFMNKGLYELSQMLHPHPSMVEGIQEAARMLLGKSIYKSSVFKDKLKCYRYRDGEKNNINFISQDDHLIKNSYTVPADYET